jgi:hypothetical protein
MFQLFNYFSSIDLLFMFLTISIPILTITLYESSIGDDIGKYKVLKSKSSLFTSTGVLFTFIGIYIGLQGFDVNNISSSMPEILSGFKGSFSSSIVGLVASYIWPVYLDLIKYKDLLNLSNEDSSSLDLKRNEYLGNISSRLERSEEIMFNLFKRFDEDASLKQEALKNLLSSSDKSQIILSEALESISKNNVGILVESLEQVMNKFDEKISLHFEGIVKNMLSQTEMLSKVVRESYDLYSSLHSSKDDIVKSVASLSNNMVSVKSCSDDMVESFGSLLKYYIRMEKNAESASDAFKNVASLSYGAKEGIRNLDNLYKEFSDRFNKSYSEDIKKATEQQANHWIDITYTILSEIKNEVSSYGK